MRKWFIMFTVLLVACGSKQNNSRQLDQNETFPEEEIILRKELVELSYINPDDLNSTLSKLDSASNFLFQNERAFRFIHVTKKSDSVHLELSTFPNSHLQLIQDSFENARITGYWVYRPDTVLIVFDETQLFIPKNNNKKIFEFGVQASEFGVEESDFIILDPLSYRYYLNNQGTLEFQSESWFSVQ